MTTSSSEIACTYACLLLHDDGLPITAENIVKVLNAANVKVESYWASLFAKLCQKRNIEELILNVGNDGGANPAAFAQAQASTHDTTLTTTDETKEVESKEEESDTEEGLFDLFG